jgi:hypothetical protein
VSFAPPPTGSHCVDNPETLCRELWHDGVCVFAMSSYLFERGRLCELTDKIRAKLSVIPPHIRIWFHFGPWVPREIDGWYSPEERARMLAFIKYQQFIGVDLSVSRKSVLTSCELPS